MGNFGNPDFVPKFCGDDLYSLEGWNQDDPGVDDTTIPFGKSDAKIYFVVSTTRAS